MIFVITEFRTERIPLERTIVGTCTADVGTCPVGSCRYKTRPHFLCPLDGVICPKTEVQEIDCGVFGVQNVEVVTECGCCEDLGIVIQGTVVASDTGETLAGVTVLINGNEVDATDDQGAFNLTVKTGTAVVAITAQDPSGIYLDAVKVVEIPANFGGPVETTVTLLPKAAAISITDPTVDRTFSLSDDPEDTDRGVAQLVIPANSITDANGNPVSGPIQISINVIDTTLPESEANLPGRFLTDGGEQLISDGVFNLEVTDASGNLLSGNILIRVREGMTIWNLDVNGAWTPAEILNRRRRRQVTLTDELLVQINNNRWVNIDKIPGAPRCYFKARVIYQNPAEAANPATYRPDILAFTPNNERLRIYAPSTSSPDTDCFEVRCLTFDPANPTNVLFGFINLTAYENVNVGGVSIPVVTSLDPLNLVDYSPAIQTAHSAVDYAVAQNQKDIFVNFISSATGPFYTDQATCEASDITQPAFHFTKQELPSYQPIPSGTDLCTARILFDAGWMFSDALANLTMLPEVTATSTWSENGTNFFFTDTTTIQLSTIDEEFYFACIQYRCSTVDEQTNVYLSVDAPLVEMNITQYGDNETMMNTTALVPAFSCYGNCDSEICYQPGSGINGTFTVDDSNGPDGPDFFDNISNDCPMRMINETFAYQFYCYGNRQYGGEREQSF